MDGERLDEREEDGSHCGGMRDNGREKKEKWGIEQEKRERERDGWMDV